MVTYCSVADVEAYVGETFSGSTSPTTAQVEKFIERAEQEIDDVTGTSYTVRTRTDDLYDYDRYTAFRKDPERYATGRTDYWGVSYNTVIKLNFYPIVAVTTLEVNRGTTETADWLSLTEGTDFIKYGDEGVIVFLKASAIPLELQQGIKITHTYGHSDIPLTVEKLCVLKAVKEVLRVKQTNSSFNNMDDITIETISISKSTGESVELLRSVQSEIDKMLDEIVGKINYFIV